MADDFAVPTVDPAATLWREELARVLASDSFAGATRIRTLLTFLVEEVLSNRRRRLKEYVVGVEALGRSSDFDPRVDTNVRTEAWRLRARLERYYASEGATNPCRIELPRRSFVPLLHSQVAPAETPTFTHTESTTPTCAFRRTEPQHLALQLLRETLPEEDEASGFGASLIDELALELGDHPGLRIAITPDATTTPTTSRQSDWTLSGSVRRVLGELRTVVHVVRTDDHEQVWSHGFQCPAQTTQDTQDLPRQIALDVARKLLTSPAVHALGINRPTPLCVTGGSFVRSLLSSGFARMASDPEALRRQVRRIDAWLLDHPQDAAAYRQLAMLLACLACAAPASRGELSWHLRRCAHSLLARPEESIDALQALALASMVDFDWYSAMSLLDTAIQAAPQCSDARVVRGLCAMHVGDSSAAQNDLEQACAIDAQSSLAFATLGLHHFQQHQFDRAAHAARHALAIDSRCEPAAVLLADAELCVGQMDEGIAVLQQTRHWSGRWPVILGRLGHAHAVMGRPHLARNLLGELQQGIAHGMQAHAAMADIHIGLGDREAALTQLGQAVQHHDLPDLLLLRSAPRYQGLRREVRFQQIIEHMMLPAAA